MGGSKTRVRHYVKKRPSKDGFEPKKKHPPYKAKRRPCLNCGKVLTIRCRGLCQTCHDSPGVKENYPHLPSPYNAYLSRPGYRRIGLGVDDPEPTRAPAGSPEKIAVLERRASQGYELFHPDDSIELERD